MMGSLKRKIKRKQSNTYMKAFKKTMKEFKNMVKCSSCDRPPSVEEKIDKWQINKKADRISLTCVDCLEYESDANV